MEFKLPYGLRENELLTIEDVESGLACNCVCPACKKQLIARKGAIKSHHFAHYKSEDCLSGLETALHKLSKEIISKSKTFTTPILHYPNTHYEVFEETEIPIENVKLETKVGEFIPDIVIETKGKKLLIEIVVSNPVSWQKLQRIKTENLPTIEIYAKYLLETLYTQKDFGLKDNLFQTELVSGTKYKRWLHNPKINSIKKSLKDNYAEFKKVKSFKTEEMGYYNFVEDCPLEKKIWKSGKNKGKPYASIDYDCNSCDFCIAIDYKQIPHKRLEFYEYSIPQNVHCIGYLKNDFRQLVKELK
jgi:competence CoiA-like predicted nuclease